VAARGSAGVADPASIWRYPAIEAATGLLAAGAILHFGLTLTGVAAALLAMVLVPVVVNRPRTPVESPTSSCFGRGKSGSRSALRPIPTTGGCRLSPPLGGGWIHVCAVARIPGGMGLGDAKFALLLGAVLGLSVIPALGIAFAVGALLGIVMIARHGAQARKTAVPFGPFLATGGPRGTGGGDRRSSDWYTSKIA